jgi:hypothetical protein
VRKKHLIFLVAASLSILAIVGSLRKPTEMPDVGPLRTEKPFAQSIELVGMSPGFNLRNYSMHMSYDEAVLLFERELGPKGWTHSDSYFRSEFRSKPKGGDSIVIYRGRMYTDVRNDLKTVATTSGAISRLAHLTPRDLSDCHDWVVVMSTRRIGFLDSALIGLRRKLSPQASRAMEFQIVAPMPKPRFATTIISATTGTRMMESETDVSIEFWAASVE